jgi:ribonuclease P protein component
MGIRRELRLKRSEDYARVRREGQVYRHRLLMLSTAPNALAHNRYGIITGKRIGAAVERNRVRRLLRETLRRQHPGLRAGHDVVIVAHPVITAESAHTIHEVVETLLRQAGLQA